MIPLHFPIMDINPSNLEPSKTMIIWGTNFAQNTVETKSFRCTFCKRGFSNAQALGGHMNIHRKDRAKLREFSCENLLSLDISKSLEDDESPPPESSDVKNPDEDLDHVEENLGKREEAAVEGGEDGGGGGGRFDKQVEGIKVELVNHGELDLELRLGPQPRHAKSKAT